MNSRWISRVEWTLGILLSLAMMGLLIVRATHTGALWRDECGTTQLALMPIGELLKNFYHQTLPPLFPLGVRLYLKIFGTSEPSVEAFRLLSGAFLIATAVVSARMSGGQPPLLLLGLFGLNSMFLYWGGYNITAISVALALILAGGLLLRPTRAQAIAFGIVALISVQLLINNLLLISILAFAAAVAALVRRSYQLALLFLIITIICAASDLIYLPLYAAADFRVLLKRQITFAWLWPHIRSAFGLPKFFAPWLWYFVFATTLLGAIWRLTIAWRSHDVPRCRLSLFVLFVSVLAPTAYCISFLLSGIATAESRHFLPMLAMLAANFDLVITHLLNQPWVRWCRVAVALGTFMLLPVASWPVLTLRQTNVDLIAHKLEQEADSNDLIVVNPWSFGISFNWYYHGKASWLTVPNLSDHRIHRFDLLKEKMMMSFPLDDVEREIVATLQKGHRVWIAGTLPRPDHTTLPLFPLPAPDPQFGWQHTIYREAWSRQLSEFLVSRGLMIKRLSQPMPNVSAMENLSLWMIEGQPQ
jgi:hypothetical protein